MANTLWSERKKGEDAYRLGKKPKLAVRLDPDDGHL